MSCLWSNISISIPFGGVGSNPANVGDFFALAGGIGTIFGPELWCMTRWVSIFGISGLLAGIRRRQRRMHNLISFDYTALRSAILSIGHPSLAQVKEALRLQHRFEVQASALAAQKSNNTQAISHAQASMLSSTTSVFSTRYYEPSAHRRKS